MDLDFKRIIEGSLSTNDLIGDKKDRKEEAVTKENISLNINSINSSLTQVSNLNSGEIILKIKKRLKDALSEIGINSSDIEKIFGDGAEAEVDSNGNLLIVKNKQELGYFDLNSLDFYSHIGMGRSLMHKINSFSEHFNGGIYDIKQIELDKKAEETMKNPIKRSKRSRRDMFKSSL
jgi:hypothetical protein